jgi:hypothetical protein
MMRTLIVALFLLACPLSAGLGDEKKAAADNEAGLVKIEVQGKLIRQDHRYCVQARNPVFDDKFLVELVRTEDKNQALDQHIQHLEGQIVTVSGVLRFSRGRIDGPALGIPVKSESQVQKAK